jgi:hypothetical protein
LFFCFCFYMFLFYVFWETWDRAPRRYSFSMFSSLNYMCSPGETQATTQAFGRRAQLYVLRWGLWAPNRSMWAPLECRPQRFGRSKDRVWREGEQLASRAVLGLRPSKTVLSLPDDLP